jgi:hypothetical protein
MRDVIITVAWFLAMGAVVVIGYWVIGGYACHARWERSGMPTSWGLFQGCLVRMPDGRWLPERALRDIELGK